MSYLNQININGRFETYAIWNSLVLANDTDNVLKSKKIESRIVDQNGVEIANSNTLP